jgi:hypothetical protein
LRGIRRSEIQRLVCASNTYNNKKKRSVNNTCVTDDNVLEKKSICHFDKTKTTKKVISTEGPADVSRAKKERKKKR